MSNEDGSIQPRRRDLYSQRLSGIIYAQIWDDLNRDKERSRNYLKQLQIACIVNKMVHLGRFQVARSWGISFEVFQDQTLQFG